MTSPIADSREVLVIRVAVTADTLSVELADSRTIAVPLTWYPRLAHGTPEERQSWRLIGGGRGIHWPAFDEDVSAANLLAGQPSANSRNGWPPAGSTVKNPDPSIVPPAVGQAGTSHPDGERSAGPAYRLRQ